MAQYDGYRLVDHSTYSEWRTATIGNGYNVDYAYGNQCWDYCALLYFQYGLPLITRPGGNGNASDCWTISREINSRGPFISVEGATNIKRGDILVWSGGTGHMAFADEDYNGTNSIRCVGQNQGQGTSGPVNSTVLTLNNFLGIFRNQDWQEPTPPPEESKKKKFPWPIAWSHWDNFKN